MAGNFAVPRWGPGRPLSLGELVVCILNGISCDKALYTSLVSAHSPTPQVSSSSRWAVLKTLLGPHGPLDLWCSKSMLNYRTFRNSLPGSTQPPPTPAPALSPRGTLLHWLLLHSHSLFPIHSVVITPGIRTFRPLRASLLTVSPALIHVSFEIPCYRPLPPACLLTCSVLLSGSPGPHAVRPHPRTLGCRPHSCTGASRRPFRLLSRHFFMDSGTQCYRPLQVHSLPTLGLPSHFFPGTPSYPTPVPHSIVYSTPSCAFPGYPLPRPLRPIHPSPGALALSSAVLFVPGLIITVSGYYSGTTVLWVSTGSQMSFVWAPWFT